MFSKQNVITDPVMKVDLLTLRRGCLAVDVLNADKCFDPSSFNLLYCLFYVSNCAAACF